jgi:3-oxoacyl-[acyl-carrier protein] reductase
MEKFNEQVVVVTGATRGIGKAIAESFLKAEAYVVGIYAENTTAAEQFEKENSHSASRFELIQCDISNEIQVQRLFSNLEMKFDSIDILINNAGVRRDSVLALMASSDWNKVININLNGTFLMCKHAVLLMMKKNMAALLI